MFHSLQGGRQLTSKGIQFAAAETGKTGAYISLSCYYHGTSAGTPVPVLDAFSAGGFTMQGVGCYNDAHITATHPALDGLTDASLSNWSCSVHEAFDKWPSDFLVLVIAEGIGGYYTAPDGTVGTPYILARGESLEVISDIKLTPDSATNPVGSNHTVTATVQEDDTATPDRTVTFKVISGPHAGTTGTDVTDGSGTATFTYMGTSVGTDTIEATFVDSLGRTQASNRVTKEWVAAETDTTAPSCKLTKTGTNAEGKKYIEVTTQDTGSGLASILVTKSYNATVTYPAFASGSKDAVIVTGTKIDNSKSSQVELKVTDVAGNVTVCDPVDLTAIREAGKPQSVTLNGIPQAEGKITIKNGNPGLTVMDFVVNGKTYQVRALRSGEMRTLDISEAMKAGDENTVKLTYVGPKGASAYVLIWDGNGTP